MKPNQIAILSLILIALVVNMPSIVMGQEAILYHGIVQVRAGEYEYINIDVTKDTIVKIHAYIYAGSMSSDIDISIIRPDGSLELVETRYTGEFQYKFKATMSGTYRLKLDNSFSTFTTKTVDIAIVVDPPPHTVTTTKTKTITSTSIITSTTTRTIIWSTTKTVEKPVTTTVTETETVTETTTEISPTTIIQEVPTIDWAKTILIAIIALVVGFIIAWFAKKESKT